MENLLPNVYDDLVNFLREPSELNYEDYVENTLKDISALSDMLKSADQIDCLLDNTQPWIAWMISQKTSDLQRVRQAWEKLQHERQNPPPVASISVG